MTAFALNESLKECCCWVGVNSALTLHFPKGVPIMPESFYETYLMFPKDFEMEKVSATVKLVRYYLQILELNGYECSDIVLDAKGEYLYVVYTIFGSSKNMHKKKLVYTGDKIK